MQLWGWRPHHPLVSPQSLMMTWAWLGSNIFSQAFILRFKWQGMSIDLDMDVTFRLL